MDREQREDPPLIHMDIVVKQEIQLWDSQQGANSTTEGGLDTLMVSDHS